jgi:hypothetical protein
MRVVQAMQQALGIARHRNQAVRHADWFDTLHNNPNMLPAS